MKERTSRTKVISVISGIKSTDRTGSEPNLFPPINRHLGNRVTLSGPRDGRREEPGKTPGNPLATRNILYRNKGLVGGRVDPRDSAIPRNVGHSTPRRKPPKLSAAYGAKKSDIATRSPFGTPSRGKDDNGAVRKKIEEFRQWHEEQYRQKLEALKARAEQETNGRIKAAEALALANMYKDKVTPLSELKLTQNGHVTGEKRDGREQSADNGPTEEVPRTAGESLPRLASRGLQQGTRLDKYADVECCSRDRMSSRGESPPAAVPSELRQRVYSSRTWRTWRQANQSDAYKDVAAYIKDNELLEDDKAAYIRDWLHAVDEARTSGQCVGTDGRPIGSGHVTSDNASSTTPESR